MKKSTDFRYNTGDCNVPWPAVGENYNADDMMEVIKFMMQGEGKEYDEITGAIKEQIEKLSKITRAPGKLSLGSHVEKAEEEASKILGGAATVFVANATAGFEIAYKYANLKPGDEVIVPAITFIATIAYPLSIGAKLVFADVDDHVNMDPKDVARKVTSKTKMIVPVHIGGYPCDMDEIMEIARKNDILVLEDAAHAFGAIYKGRPVGTIGDFGGYSFHEVKNITSFGEGGILTTSIKDFGNDMKRSRFFGLDFSCPIKDWLYNVTAIQGKYGPYIAGNSSTTEIQALGLELQMKRNSEIIRTRREAAEYLSKRFGECDAIIPQDLGEDVEPTFHLYLLKLIPEKAGGNIQALKAKLKEKGVTEIAHFGPLYRFQAVQDMGYNSEEIAKSCPNCEDIFYKRYTHLPIYGLSQSQLEYLADAVLNSIKEMQEGR